MNPAARVAGVRLFPDFGPVEESQEDILAAAGRPRNDRPLYNAVVGRNGIM
jgi:hypothetical protein